MMQCALSQYISMKPTRYATCKSTFNCWPYDTRSCVLAILCSNNPGAVPELQTYGLTSYQTVITIVKHIMEKLRYKDSAMAGGWWTLVTLLASRVYWSVIVCTYITEPMELPLACVLGLFHILKEVKCLQKSRLKSIMTSHASFPLFKHDKIYYFL
jgi:hypothetical protein